MTGATTPETQNTPDLRGREVVIVAPLFVLMIALGVAPSVVLDPVDDATQQTLDEVGVTDPEPVFAVEGGEE